MKRLTRPIDHAYYGDMEERLLDIEDILGDDYDLNRLGELSEADKEGRIVVLPAEAINARHDVAYILGGWKQASWRQDAGFENMSVGVYGLTWAESRLLEAIIDTLNKGAQP